MKIENIARILEQHSVPYYIDGSRIYADTMLAFGPSEYEDLTGYSLSELRFWMGY